MEILWKLFGSHKNVVRALTESKGYDMSPGSLQLPANTDAPRQTGLTLESEEDAQARIARVKSAYVSDQEF